MTQHGRPRWTIQQHLVLFATALALPLLATLGYALRAERNNSAAAIDAAAVQLSRLAAAGVGQFIDQSRLLMESASRDPIAVAGHGDCSPELRQLPRLRPEFATIAVIGTNGSISCSVPSARGGSRSVAGSTWFRRLRRSRRFTVAAQVADPVGSRSTAILALPWREHGGIRGYLTVTVDMLRYQQPFIHLGLPNQALVGIADDHRIVHARTLGPRRAVGKRYDPIPVGNQRTVTASGGDGVLRVYAAAAVPGTSWQAYAGLPTSFVLAASDHLLHTVLRTAFVALLLAAAAASVVSRRITGPVRRLSAAAARVADGDTAARAEVAGPAEVAAAAAEFNKMVENAAAVEEARQTALRRLAQADKMEAIGRLAGGVAHDFNNLLLAIRGYSELALQRRTRAGEDDADLREVLSATERAARLTQQLLVFGRRQPTQPEAIDLGEVVEDMEKMLRRLIGENIELVCTHAERPVGTLGDRGQLEQIVANLAINARDAMPEGGKLTIAVSEIERDDGGTLPAGRYALLAVTDTGCGIDADTAAHIFEPFFSTKGEYGTGLGLATVQSIATQSGGEVLVYSEPGKGTTFAVYLPAHDPVVDSKPDNGSAEPPAQSSGTILLVEDDPVVRLVVQMMLSDEGFHILAADGGEAAVALARRHKHPIDLLITDLVMPGLSGPETAQRIRASRPDLRVLYMSGYADDPVYRTGGALGRDAGFIQKPFGTAELRRQIAATRLREIAP